MQIKLVYTKECGGRVVGVSIESDSAGSLNQTHTEERLIRIIRHAVI